MAIAATTLVALDASATAGNVNGGGFNFGNANFPTDGAFTSANTSAPVLSSATYNFVAGDVGAWIYSKTTTNPGFYKISSVAANAATLNATIGQGVVLNAVTGRWGPSTIVGVDSAASPTGKTFGVDYSQSTAAKIVSVADFNAIGASTTLTSATAGFTPVMVGNIFHQTTTGTGAFGVVGWYEIVSYTNVTTVVLDRTPNSGTASVNTTGSVGGALSMGALDDASMEAWAPGNEIFVKNGTYTIAGTVSISLVGTAVLPIYITGFATVRGDNPSAWGASSTAPLWNQGTVTVTWGTRWILSNMRFTGTAAIILTIGSQGRLSNCKVTNTSSTAGRNSVTAGAAQIVRNCEIICYKGTALTSGSATIFQGNYIHDSNIGISRTNSDTNVVSIIDNIVANCVTDAIVFTGSPTGIVLLDGNTLSGFSTPTGIGIDLGGSTIRNIENNIITGFVTGITATTLQGGDFSGYNDFFNNTTDVTNWTKDATDKALNPTFTNVTQLANVGTVTSATNVLTDSGADFSSVVDGIDHVYIVSGSGTAFATGIYGITSHTGTTLTLAGGNLTSSGAGTSIVYRITLGNNYGIGTNLKALGTPGTFPGALSVGYMDIGAVQRQEASSSSFGNVVMGGVFNG